jgi:four helix bundle protein
MPERKYDLEERTARFGENTIIFCHELEKNEITKPLINQLIKCATSIGANYCEADDAESSKDFKHKIGICKKEARETTHFLRMMITASPNTRETSNNLLKEATELNLIFNAIYKKVS